MEQLLVSVRSSFSRFGVLWSRNPILKDGAFFIVLSVVLLGVLYAKTTAYLAAIYAPAAVAVFFLARTVAAAQSTAARRNLFAILLYGTLIAFLTITYRDAAGYMESVPFRDLLTGQIPRELFPGGSAQMVYDKRDLKELLFAFFLSLAFSSILMHNLALHISERTGVKRLSPYTPSVLLLLCVAFAIFPPVRLDLTHWASWIGPASGIGEGRWPYIHTHAQYGLVPAFLIWGWIKAFGFSEMSLSLFVSATGLGAGFAVYYLVRRLTGSPLTGFMTAIILSYSYVSRDAYALFPNMGPIRSQLPTALAMLFLFLSYPAKRSAFVFSALYGLTVLWEPALGFFLLCAFVLSHVLKRLKGERESLKKIVLCMGAVMVPLLLIYLNRPPEYGPLEAVRNILRQYAAFSQGFATLPQVFPPEAVISYLFLVLAVWMAVRRFMRGGLALSDRELFLVSSAGISAFWVLYSMSRSVVPYFYPLVWAVAPGLACLAFIFLRVKRVRAAAGILSVVILAASPTGGRVKSGIEGYMTRYEQERFDWYTGCVDGFSRGAECDIEEMPGLRNAVRKASRPLLEETGGNLKIKVEGKKGNSEVNLELPGSEQALAESCKAGIPVVSNLDSHIYMENGCLPGHRFLSLSILTSKSDIDEFTREIEKKGVVAFDTRPVPHGLDRIQEGIRKRLEADGFREYERCSQISLLGNGSSQVAHCPRSETLSYGSWRADEKTLTSPGDYSPARVLFDLPPGSVDYRFRSKVKVIKGNAAGLIIKGGGQRYFAFYVNTGDNAIEFWEHDGKGEMSRRQVFSRKPEGVFLKKLDWYEMEAKVKGEKAEFFINGIPQGEADISMGPGGDKAGFWASASEAVFMDPEIIKE